MASTSSVSGLVSGMDTTSLITQLMQIEAQPQTLLQTRLSATKTDAAAYRDINSAYSSLASAAQALMQPSLWDSVKATSSATSVSASATTGAKAGSIAFTVDKLATNHTIYTGASWSSTSQAFGDAGPLTISWPGSGTTDSISLTDSDGDGAVSLAEAVDSINKAGKGVSATSVNTGSGYRLQLTSAKSGLAGKFDLSAATIPAGSLTTLTAGADAEITVGGTGGYKVTSSSNTFTGVMDGVTFTVGQTTGTDKVTVSVTSNPDAVSSAVQTFVDAANTVGNRIGSYTDPSSKTAPLKGNYNLTSLAGQILDAISTGVGGSSAGVAGLQLTKDGAIAFDANVFKTKLASDPALVQKMFAGTTLPGTDGIAGTPDDVVGVDGIGARISVLAERASDNATGILITLAKGQDSLAKDLQDQIDAWDIRLAKRKETLTAQFSAMETALSTLQNQASWLNSQISALAANSATMKSSA